jgi:NAD(P)H dehydrogenase (quinone)
MNKPLILVTGAAGNTGGAVVDALLAHDMPVRALVRRKDARSEALERKGAQIAIADVFDAQQIADAMRGVQRAYFVPPYAPNMTESAETFVEASKVARLEAIAVMSQWLASPDHPAMLTRMHFEVDRLFATIPGIAHITIAPGYFADNYLRLIDFAAQLGILPNLTGNSRNAPPSNEDIAKVTAATLVNPAAHAGKRYRPTGPELLSVPDMAATLSRVLGHRVRSVSMPYWLFLKAARLQGVQPFDLDSLSYYVKDHRDGAFEFGAPNDDVLRVTGQPAESFETTARRYAALPKAQRTLARRTRAWLDFLRTPLSPGYDLAAYERRQCFPRLEKPLFAMQNARWRTERSALSAVAAQAA